MGIGSGIVGSSGSDGNRSGTSQGSMIGTAGASGSAGAGARRTGFSIIGWIIGSGGGNIKIMKICDKIGWFNRTRKEIYD